MKVQMRTVESQLSTQQKTQTQTLIMEIRRSMLLLSARYSEVRDCKISYNILLRQGRVKFEHDFA